jgi:hypothetical protein
MPIPTPTTNCPINNIAGPLANALAAAPAQIISMSASISGFRPKWSAIVPPSPAPNTAPSTRLAPMRPTTSGVRWSTAIIRGIATPSTKIAKPSSSVPPVDSTQSHRWIPFSGDTSSRSASRCAGVTSPNFTSSSADSICFRRRPDDIRAEFRPGSRLVLVLGCPRLQSAAR